MPTTKATIAHKIAPTNHENIIGKLAPPKKPDVAALIDSILLIDGPAINLSNGIDKIIITNILLRKIKG